MNLNVTYLKKVITFRYSLVGKLANKIIADKFKTTKSLLSTKLKIKFINQLSWP